MRNNAAAQSPGDGSCEIVMLTTRQNRHPVHTTTGALKASARSEKSQLRGVDTDIPSVTSRHIAMLLSGKFNYPIPNGHVRNRIN